MIRMTRKFANLANHMTFSIANHANHIMLMIHQFANRMIRIEGESYSNHVCFAYDSRMIRILLASYDSSRFRIMRIITFHDSQKFESYDSRMISKMANHTNQNIRMRM